jgi:hypothetical protein
MAVFVGKVASKIGGNFAPGSAGYSVLFGGLYGVGLAGVVATGRAGYVTLMDHDYYKNESRQRYLDKQTIFSQEFLENSGAQRLASLAAEYDPVATRKPFDKFEDKYRF